MSTLKFITNKYALDWKREISPIEIPDVGRNDLARLFAELDFAVGVEVGVERGYYAEVLCKSNPHALIYGVDPWKAYPGYREHVSQEKLCNFFEETIVRMEPYNWDYIRATSMQALDNFQDESLDFVYIDGNHAWQYITQDIYHWQQKVRKGGIVSGHDYRLSRRMRDANHVVYVVNAYTQSFRISPWFLLGRKDVRQGEVRDSSRSWMWVKE
jgi:hypothetical protein